MNALQRLEKELAEHQETKLTETFQVRFSKTQLKVLNEAASKYNLKQSDILRFCIERLPALMNTTKN